MLRTAAWSMRAGVVIGALVSVATSARADDPTKEQCLSANEGAQTLRQSGKLRAARAQLLVCIAKTCPGPVRDDCSERLNELEKALPTVVFAAKGPDGNDLSAVKVTMDGTPLVERLDGSAIVVDPGEHVFEFTAAGYPTVTRKLIVREGMKGRDETIAFASTAPAPIPVPVAPVATTTSAPPPSLAPVPEQPSVESGGSGRRVLAYVLGGVGVVGLGLGTYFGLKAKSTYDDASSHCPTASSCDATGVRGGQDAHNQAMVSTISFIAGGALLAGGVIVFLTAPKNGAVSVQPTAGAEGMGLRVGGVF